MDDAQRYAIKVSCELKIKVLEELKEYALLNTGLPGALREHIDNKIREYQAKIYEVSQ